MTPSGRNLLAGLLGALLAGGAYGAQFDLERAKGVVRQLGIVSKPLPEADEIALGRELAGQLLGATPLVDDRRAQLYVNRVGSWIAWQSERPDLPWRFGVVESTSLNVYSLPGGHVFITRGLYAALEDEAQLAGAFAHAIAAIERRHHSEIARRRAGTAAMANIAQEVASQRARSPELLSGVLGRGAEMFTRQLDRAAIFEADARAVSLAESAGYNPTGLLDVLRKLQMRRHETSGLEALHATHPPRSERLAKLDAAITPMIGSPRATVPLPLQRIAPVR